MIKKYKYKDYEEYIKLQTSKAKRTRGRTRSQSRINRREYIFEKIKELNIKGKSILCLGARDDTEVLFFEDKGYEAIGIDLLKSEKIIQCDMSKILKHPYFKKKKYDIVFASESLEHCMDFKGFIKGLNKICKKYFIVMGPTSVKIKKESAKEGFKEVSPWDCNVQEFMCYEKEEDQELYRNSLLNTFKEFDVIINEVHKRGSRIFFILKKKNK